jgi:nitroreductase
MNEIIKAMMERRSIRKFKSDMVSKKDIDEIIEAGLYAANGMGRQAVITVAVTNKELRDKIAEDNRKIGGWDKGFDPFYGAPVILIVLAEKDWRNKVYDGSLVIGNMMLAAHSLGLGSIWIHRAKEEFETEEYKKLLKDIGVQGEWEGIGHCAIGYIDGDIPKPAPRKENRVYFVS